MAGEWERVARWAGIGHNRREGRTGDDGPEENKQTMVEEGTVQSAEERELVREDAAGAQPMEVEADEKSGAVGALMNELDQTRTERDQIRGERDQLRDRMARMQAEFENARKREGKERADARDYATQNAIEPFLGVMDNFQLALKAEGSVEQLRSGVELILKQMDEALKGLQVQPVESVGTQFDPRVHEALGSVETTEFPDHQVLEEIRRGYKLKDKLLRPALVKIATNAAQVAE
jgi:molecular chaperone GrpE